MPNRLAGESSPYLLQHANNPVDWYPWAEAAFDKARREDKPIFLSVGYSTCHWCHVMERESFEDDRVASVLNQEFVSVKVDREERPDVDRVYMIFVQATAGSGGWPMSVWLTPDLEPFYGGTYFPREARLGQPGFVDVLQQIARTWKAEREEVVRSARHITTELREHVAATLEQGEDAPLPGEGVLARGVEQLRLTYDARRGGFGGAPKFPRPSELLFLFREHARTAGAEAREMALHALRAMALGGMRDHLGGGFHRYAVDAEWRVPHFEKMLYDQAQLVLACLEAGQVTGERMYWDVANDTLQYIRRDLTDASGAFFSAEDADSVPPEQADDPGAHKSEGAFYIWGDEEIGALLGEDADPFRFRFGIEPEGNAPFDSHGEFTKRNLLYTARSIADVARLSGLTEAEAAESLERARRTLFDARSRRPRPHLDDKILTGWNGLMVAAFARAARVLLSVEYLEAARRAAGFIRSAMWDGARGVVLRRCRRGQVAVDGYAEDYAHLVFGLLELFQADADPAWLEWALALQARQDALFWDPLDGGWFSTTGHDPSVLLRLKEDYDGAEPSASAVSVLNVLTLAHLVGGEPFAARAEQALRWIGPRLGQQSRALPMMMAALSAYQAGIEQVVVVGRRGDPDLLVMREILAASYRPFSVQVVVEPGADQDRLSRVLPFVAPMTMREGRATAYVCRQFVCQEPVADIERFRALLARG